MILWVIEKVSSNTMSFLAKNIKERYQYILVDEISRYKMDLKKQSPIFLLSDFLGKKPNLFIVGDDDPKYFLDFQGAQYEIALWNFKR
jgi:superfamily I DNA/RNA helicase